MHWAEARRRSRSQHDAKHPGALAQFLQRVAVMHLQFIAILGEQGWPVLALRDRARRAAQPRLLVRHLQQQEEFQLLHVVAIRQAVIAQDAAVVPELGDEGRCSWTCV